MAFTSRKTLHSDSLGNNSFMETETDTQQRWPLNCSFRALQFLMQAPGIPIISKSSTLTTTTRSPGIPGTFLMHVLCVILPKLLFQLAHTFYQHYQHSLSEQHNTEERLRRCNAPLSSYFYMHVRLCSLYLCVLLLSIWDRKVRNVQLQRNCVVGLH